MAETIVRHGLRGRAPAALVGILFVATLAAAQQKPKLRALRIALPSHSVSATAVYVAQRLGVFERLGFDAQILVLEPRAALAAMLTGDLDFYAAVGTVGRAALTGVPVDAVTENQTPGRRVHEPGNPQADAQGYVTYSNVNAVEEMVNMISASRSYQNNVEVMNTAKNLLLKTLQLGQ